jgi:threonine dehydratase
MMTYDLLKRALNARVADVLPEPTPLDRAANISERLQHPIYLKREDLTPVFSFKLRGAYNRITALDPAELARGVIAASAGNHAQGVAFAARRLGIACRIVMPRTTPSIKVAAVRRLGAQIDLAGDSYSDAAAPSVSRSSARRRAIWDPSSCPSAEGVWSAESPASSRSSARTYVSSACIPRAAKP